MGMNCLRLVRSQTQDEFEIVLSKLFSVFGRLDLTCFWLEGSHVLLVGWTWLDSNSQI